MKANITVRPRLNYWQQFQFLPRTLLALFFVVLISRTLILFDEKAPSDREKLQWSIRLPFSFVTIVPRSEEGYFCDKKVEAMGGESNIII